METASHRRDTRAWSQDDLTLVLESIPHIVWITTPDGRTEYFNQRGVAFTGLAPEETSGWGWLTVVHPDDVKRARRDWQAAVRAGTPLATEYRVRHADGDYRWVASLAQPVRSLTGNILRWVGTWTDLEEQKQTQQRLREAATASAESMACLDALQLTAPFGFGFVDREFRLRQINDTLARLNGLSADTALGRSVAELLPSEWPRLEPIFQRVLCSGECVSNVDVARVAPDGEGRQWLATYYPVRIDDRVVGVGFVGIDVTSRTRADALRAAVTASMAEGLCALDRRGRLTFMNDAASRMLGWTEAELRGRDMHAAIHFQHADGSRYPKEDCPLLRVRREPRPITVEDDALTRKDGSIFPAAVSVAPLINGTDFDGAVILFRDTTEEKSELERTRRELTALSWVGRIREALDDGRFVLFAQPIVPLLAGEPSEELLVRMIGRSGEIISPGAFLPIAERFGMITEIDQWVIRRAISLAAPGRRVKVNVSAESILRIDLLSVIEQQLRDSNADPSLFVFELTETALLRDLEAGRRFATGLVELGCKVALDDFGTGFGSFTYLKKLPIHYLKIDIEFVRDLSNSVQNQHVVKAIVSLARGFGQQTIAEGVEDAATMALLREYGVDYAQGFFIGKPAPA
jgi:PAS domain S-box-containing protein